MKHRLSLLSLVLVASIGGAAEPHPGAAIYAKQCAKCHGEKGEGVKGKKVQPLVGEKTVAQLAKAIATTMPEDNVGSCVGKDADAVAAYIHDAFYSIAARERLNPTRIELARLTVSQYRNAVADIVGGFRFAPPKLDDKRGLQAEYFKKRRFNNGEKALDRLDTTVNFDFEKNSPVPDMIEPGEFSIRWSGSVLAPETGDYEFIVRSDHAIKLFVNDSNTPLIDRWVKSGTDTDFKASLYLIGGRTYPLRLEFSKAKQGVDDSKKNPNPPVKPAFIKLDWKPPHGAEEPIPGRCLSPNRSPEVCVISTPFPPDDRSYGWERGTTVSKAWDAATTDAAIETANAVLAKLRELSGASATDANAATKFKEFAGKFVERAFRKPLTPELKTLYVDRHFEETKEPLQALKRVLLLALKSPRFLYREVGDKPDGYDVAARLSFALWDSIPDVELLTAASKGQLATPDQVRKQADRMLADPRTRLKLRGFLQHWLKVDESKDVAKDPKRFPGFDAAAVSDLRTSLDLFLDEIVWSDTSDFRQLFRNDEVYLNGRLAKLYGVQLSSASDFRKVALDPGQRAGVLTHPFLMTTFAYTAETSPIHRGVFLGKGILGINLKPPQEAFSPLSADLHPTLNTRERVALQTKGDNCMICHAVINPLGFTLEGFDAIGRVREKDNNKPVETTGFYILKSGEKKTFSGPRDLGEFLASNPEAHSSFAEQMFHHLVQQSIRAYGLTREDELRASFAANGFSIRKLAAEIAATAALKGRASATASR